MFFDLFVNRKCHLERGCLPLWACPASKIARNTRPIVLVNQTVILHFIRLHHLWSSRGTAEGFSLSKLACLAWESFDSCHSLDLLNLSVPRDNMVLPQTMNGEGLSPSRAT